ncbi:MAG: hypothetical protein ACBR12_14635 [Microcoleus sp.]
MTTKPVIAFFSSLLSILKLSGVFNIVSPQPAKAQSTKINTDKA